MATTHTDGPIDLKRARRHKQEPEDRKPPHSTEAEQGVLGCILLSPDEVFDQIGDKLKAEAFYDLRHRTIFEAMLSLREKRTPIDSLTVLHLLQRDGALQSAGGLAYLASLPDTVPSAANVLHYFDIVQEHYMLRQLLGFAERLMETVYAPSEPDKILELVERDVLAITEHRRDVATEQKQSRAVLDYMQELEEIQNGNVRPSLQTGFAELDRALGGFEPGESIILGAATSVGKSCLAANIAANLCDLGIGVGLFSLEMPRRQLFDRWIADCVGEPIRYWRAHLSEGDRVLADQVAQAARHIADWPLKLCDQGNLAFAQIRNRARRWKREGVKLIIIDYLQLVKSGIKGNRTEQVEYVSNELKNMAMDLQLPVLSLAQLSRDHKKEDRRPRLDDLRQCGAIEQDADKVLLLHPQGKIVECWIRKNRNEKRDVKVDLEFNPKLFRFEEIREESAI